MWYFCKYKDILGKPGEGLHSYRIYNISVLDVLFTFLLAKFIQYYILEEYEFLMILISCFAAGIVLHRVFCVKTTIDKLLFG